MLHDYAGLGTTALKANEILKAYTREINSIRKDADQTEYKQTYSRNKVSTFPKLTRRSVDVAVKNLEESGYEFNMITKGHVQQYGLTIADITKIYEYNEIPKYRDKYKEPVVIYVVNLKGGVSKTVSTVTLAHTFRVHPDLIRQDLRILVIDFDPQASSTMFLNHNYSIGSVTETAAQAIINNISEENLRQHIIKPTMIPGVDIIPASIDDAFVASEWVSLVEKHLPGMSPYEVLKKNLIDRVANDYDFIFLDTGPHLDALMLNALAASDFLLTPTPPSQVDFHSTMKYLTRVPEMLEKLENSGIEIRLKGHIGFMSKMTNKSDHKAAHSIARDVFGSSILDTTLPRLDGFERCGEMFDTIVTANPQTYPGSLDALKKAKDEADNFAISVFDRIELIRSKTV
ncbi:AAA family ATPase [Buttiauxella gaviniae]|jgi:cellulose biosynthesis protein BcsQ|uniref:AAA family ATPase n=1 Tax=Buttiauxella gaviniae TaxID=82990 RepID=UPI003C793F86